MHRPITLLSFSFGLAILLTYAADAANYALQFDGQNDYVNCGQCAAVQQTQSNTITIECWVKTEEQVGVLVTNRQADDGCDFPTLMVGDPFGGSGCAEIAMDDRMTFQACRSNSNVNDGEWHHIAGTKDGANWVIYVDGQEDGQMNYDYQMSGSNYDLHLGHQGAWGNNLFSGLIDEVRIWNYARSADQIAQSWNASLTGNEDGLIAYWRLDEGDGQTTADKSPNGYDATLGNSGDQDDQDPQWVESDAPIYGGELWASADSMGLGPVVRGGSRSKDMALANTAEENDEMHVVKFSLTDEGDGVDWLDTDPMEGSIAVGDTVEVTLTIVNTIELDVGNYQRTLRLQCNAVNVHELDIPVSMSVVSGSGRLYGTVTDAKTGDPIEWAEIRTDIGLADRSDADGHYEITELPAWTYTIVVLRTDYLLYRVDNVEIADSAEKEMDFALLHSEFTPDPASFNLPLPPDTAVQKPLTIHNGGNGQLNWSLNLAFPKGVDQPPWNMRESFFVGDSVNDNKIQGAVFVDGNFYVAGGEKDTNYIYVIARDGHKVTQFHQMGSSRYGYNDLDYDGELIWGSSGSTFYGFTTGGDSVTSFVSPVNSPQAIAWDPVDSLYWISGLSGDIYGVNRQGQQVGQRIRLANFQIYGLAYYPDDPDGRPLYIYRQYGDSLMVTKTSTARSDTMRVAALMPEKGGKAGGAFITRRYDPYSWVFIATANATAAEGNDRVDVWQLKTNTGWVAVDQLQGVTDAGADADLTVSLNTRDMLAAQYHVDLAFRHDGVGGADTIPLNLTVVPPDTGEPPPPENHPPSAFELLMPADSAMMSPRDTAETFIWNRSSDPDVDDTVHYEWWIASFLLQDSLSRTLSDTVLTINTFEILRDFGWNGEDILQLVWWVSAISGMDTIECNQRFLLQFEPWAGVGDASLQPGHFGLNATYPNPFNSRLLVDYGLDKAGEASVSIYDLLGREVALLASGRQAAGRYRLVWDAAAVPSGVYLIRLAAATRVETRKVVLVR